MYRTIFECLAGARLTATQVAQKCHLPLRQAKAGVAGLIQLRLIHHYTARDAATVYSANLTNAYDIVRTGHLIEEARRTHGDTAADVIAVACQVGFGTVGELRDRVALLLEAPSHEDTQAIDKVIEQLLEDNYLIHLRRAHFGETHDVRREIESKLLSPAAISKLTGSKAKLEHEENINRGYDEATNTANSETGHVNHTYLNDHSGRSSDAMEEIVNGHAASLVIVVQPNYYKVVDLAQRAVIGSQARRMHGKKAAAVLQCAIKQASFSDIWSKPPPLHAPTHQLNMYKLLDDVNVERQTSADIDTPKFNGMVNGNHSHRTERDLTLDDLESELMLMTESEFHFLEDMGTSTFQIQKRELDQWTRKEETLRVMDSRLDPPAPRILRILINKGKLEERTLQEIGLLGAKELRQSLSMLKQMGYLELQEIPRNPQRMPNQTVFLWSFEQDRVATLVLENVYTSMVRLLQLLKLERKHIATTLTKLERADVKGKEEEVLPAAELTFLTRFRKVESWVWAEMHRLDSTVAILRDT